VRTVEGSAVADGQDLLARRVHPGAAITLNVVDQLAGDVDVRIADASVRAMPALASTITPA
jgi:hypothetical protein